MTEQQILSRIDKLHSLHDVEELKAAIFELDVHRSTELLAELRASVLRMCAKEHPLAAAMARALV